MTITVWLKEEIALNWANYKNDLTTVGYYMTTREPGDLDFIQVNITVEQYKQIKSHLL